LILYAYSNCDKAYLSFDIHLWILVVSAAKINIKNNDTKLKRILYQPTNVTPGVGLEPTSPEGHQLSH
jgi:hypothetical protein